jgi:isopenicillin N synthase-like dioxygenase
MSGSRQNRYQKKRPLDQGNKTGRQAGTPGTELEVYVNPTVQGNTNLWLYFRDNATLSIVFSSATEIEKIRGGKWVRVPIRPGELHINVSQILRMWSRGLFQSNVHRVSKQATGEDRLPHVFFAANAKTREDYGVAPVCAMGEEPLFERLSLPDHIANFTELYFGKE